MLTVFIFMVNVIEGFRNPYIDQAVCVEWDTKRDWQNRGAGCYPIRSGHLDEEKK
jgi:hypothetical protein